MEIKVVVNSCSMVEREREREGEGVRVKFVS